MILSKAEADTNDTRTHFVLSMSGDADAFYQIIIDNNLFRPLGWRTSAPSFPYQLIGTVIYIGKKNPIAIIQETTTEKKTYFVTIGDSLGETNVIGIQAKQVVLDKDGEQIILSITPQFLNLPRFVRTVHGEKSQKSPHSPAPAKNQRTDSKTPAEIRRGPPVVYRLY